MTNTLSVRTGDVTGFRAFSYTHHGPDAHCGYLFPMRHTLHVYIEDKDFQTLASADGSATLLRVSLRGRVAKLSLIAPDFREKDTVFPFERAAKQRDVDVTVSGEAVLRRVATKPVRYEVVVGMLRCACAPMFDAMRDAPGRVSALASLWPTLPRVARDLDYVFTPFGLALEGALDLRMPERRDLLLLPRHQPGATDGDVAWKQVAHTEKDGTHVWERLDKPPAQKEEPNLSGLVEALRADAPDSTTWPVAHRRWAVLRWRLITPGRQPLIDHCLNDAPGSMRLQRSTAEEGAGQVHADVVCQLSVVLEGSGPRLEHAGMVCAVTGATVAAQFIWDGSERNSVMTARTARAGLWLAGAAVVPPAALLSVVRLTLRTAPARGEAQPNLKLAWSRTDGPSAAQLTLEPTGMLCGGTLSGSAGLEPPAAAPTWLMCEEGCLQFMPGALPLDGDGDRPAAALLAAAADSVPVFRGGLPLDRLGGPDGLAAWVAADTSGADPQVVLRISSDSVELDLFDAILLWRTPGWWACTAPAQPRQARLPPVAAAFVGATVAASPGSDDAAAKLGQALATVLYPALWVGRAGGTAERGWPLAIDGAGKLGLTLPAAAVRSTIVWSAFRDAYLVQTVPAGDQGLGGALLDPGRALVPLTHAAGEKLELAIGRSGLPRLATARYPAPSALAAGWQPLDGEFFHPAIAGLTLEPSKGRYTYRHGPPMLADGYLRARVDGSLAGTLASAALDAVRSADDIALADIPVALPSGASYQVSGWLPAPHSVTVSALALELGGADPHLAMQAAGGADGSEPLALRIGSRDDGFAGAVAVASDGIDRPPYLTGDVGRGKLLRNFGQSLTVDDGTGQLRDGAGQRWRPFANGERTLHMDAANPPEARRMLTGQRRASLDCGRLGVAELVLCLADADPQHPDEGEAWDLSGPFDGHRATLPMLGPFAVQADALRWIDADAIDVTARLLPPPGADDLAPAATGGSMILHWRRSANAWDLGVAAGSTFEWRMAALPGHDASLAAIAGTVAATGGQLQVLVTRVGLHTTLGEVSLPCKPAALDSATDDATGPGAPGVLAAPIDAIESGGVTTRFVVAYQFAATDSGAAGSWRIGAAPDASLLWETKAGKLGVQLGAGQASTMTFTDAGGNAHTLALTQASPRQWLVTSTGTGGVEFAGCLERQDTATDQPTQLRLVYRWTDRLDKPAAVFGPVHPASRVRVDGSAEWRSGHWGGSAAPRQRSLSGHLVLDNDYAFAFQQIGGEVVTMVDRVHCYFDGVALDDNGVAGGILYAMVEHRFHADTDLVSTDPVDTDRVFTDRVFTDRVDIEAKARFSFQVPQAIALVARAGGAVGMAANPVILVRVANANAPEVVEQVLYQHDPALGACHAPALPDQVGGTLLRMPLRTGSGRAVLKVPAPRLPDLDWFPVVQAAPQEPQGVTSLWQERRALAHALHATTLSGLCGSQTQALFDNDAALPEDGAILEEWSTVGHASGWLHSGWLGAGAGVVATPHYGGVLSRDTPAGLDGATPVTLYLPDPEVTGGLRPVARALVADAVHSGAGGVVHADNAALLAWGEREMLRRSLRTAALVLAHGWPTLSGKVGRPFLVAAVDDEAVPPGLAPVAAHQRYSAMLELMFAAEAQAAPRQILAVRTDQDAVVEVVDAQPLVHGGRAALRFRLALNHLVDEEGGTAPVAVSGAALGKRQQVQFREQLAGAPAPHCRLQLPLAWPLPATVTPAVSPPVVDVCTTALRPGDTVYTGWAMVGDAADTGPGVALALRLPRAGHTVGTGTTLGIGTVAETRLDGVGWVLREVTAARPLGVVPAPIVQPGVEVTLVTGRGTAHRLVPLGEGAGPGPKLTLGVAAQRTDADDAVQDGAQNAELALRLLDPLLCGAFPRALAGLAPVDAELAWAVAAGDAGRGPQAALDPALVSSVEQITASAGALDAWAGGEQIRVVRLGEWQSLADRADLPGPDPSLDPGRYSLAPGANLAELLRLTRQDRNTPRHWLLKEGLAAGPLLVLLIRSGTVLRHVVAFAIDWNRGAALEQPQRVLAVRSARVLGFGDLAGPTGIRVEGNRFILYTSAYALDHATADAKTPALRAWLFGPGGACTAMQG